eukprot:scaffold1702_cov253-Pinguiococcus_pyrenoidosus.AAC.7
MQRASHREHIRDAGQHVRQELAVQLGVLRAQMGEVEHHDVEGKAAQSGVRPQNAGVHSVSHAHIGPLELLQDGSGLRVLAINLLSRVEAGGGQQQWEAWRLSRLNAQLRATAFATLGVRTGQGAPASAQAQQRAGEGEVAFSKQ